MRCLVLARRLAFRAASLPPCGPVRRNELLHTVHERRGYLRRRLAFEESRERNRPAQSPPASLAALGADHASPADHYCAQRARGRRQARAAQADLQGVGRGEAARANGDDETGSEGGGGRGARGLFDPAHDKAVGRRLREGAWARVEEVSVDTVACAASCGGVRRVACQKCGRNSTERAGSRARVGVCFSHGPPFGPSALASCDCTQRCRRRGSCGALLWSSPVELDCGAYTAPCAARVLCHIRACRRRAWTSRR